MAGLSVLSPNALTTLERATAYLKRDAGAADGEMDAIIDAVNRSTAEIESFCGRNLRARTYRNPATINCTIAADGITVTGAGFTASVKALDDAVGTLPAEGSRVLSITSDTTLVLDRKGTAGTANITFGSAPMIIDGQGTYDLWFAEFPVTAVWSVNWLNETGVKTPLTMSGSRLELPVGQHLVLPQDWVPRGDANVQIECQAGYRKPSATDPGDREDWNALERACLRLTEVFFQDWSNNWGRKTDSSLGNVSSQVAFEMPRDIAITLGGYRRLG